MEKVVLTGQDLTLDELVAIARQGAKVELSDETRERAKKSRAIVDEIVEEEKTVYGINTGFGSLHNVHLAKDETMQLQENLIRTHASGYGEPLPEDEVRAVMAIRVNSLVKGVSGVSMAVIDTLLAMLNKGVTPHIPAKGSVGASGDLAPLSHMVAPMIGLGYAFYQGKKMTGKEAMEAAGIPTIKLQAKDGLALNNGTTVLTAIGALATYDAIQLLKLSDIAGALSLEAHRGIIDAFWEDLHVLRPHKGCLATAKNVRALTDGSTYITHTAQLRTQDAYSLRCMPQIHGASKDTVAYVLDKVNIEINAATDNPILLSKDEVISGGNFHGEPMAQPFDFLGIGAAEVGNVSERRIERLLNHNLSDFPAFLVKKPGLNSGFMITQYAAAALASENKVLAHPASVDSIPTCENQEDFVSMGTIAARQARDIIKNSRRCVATEILAACQALDFRKELTPEGKMGVGTQIAYDTVREHCKFIADDSEIFIYDELEKISQICDDGTLLKAVTDKVALDIQ